MTDPKPPSEAMQSERKSTVRGFLSTGSTLLDIAIADRLPGGIPVGRITHLYGQEATGKSAIIQAVLGAAQRAGGRALYDDAEGTLDFGRAHLFGLEATEPDWEADQFEVDTPSFAYWVSTSVEEFFDRRLRGILEKREANKGRPGPWAIALDTLTALSSKIEQQVARKDGLEKIMAGRRAGQISAAFRVYLSWIMRSRLALVVVDQERENVRSAYGGFTVSGGMALRFYSSVRVRLNLEGHIKNKIDQAVGVEVGFYIAKNKVAPPYRQGSFRILFDYGIDDVGSNLQWLKEAVEKKVETEFEVSGTWLKWRDLKQQGIDKLAADVEAAGLETDLAVEVYKTWRRLYQPLERKGRYPCAQNLRGTIR